MWAAGYLPHNEPTLFVMFPDGRPARLIGRYIASCQVGPRKSLFLFAQVYVNEGVRDRV